MKQEEITDCIISVCGFILLTLSLLMFALGVGACIMEQHEVHQRLIK